MSSPPTTGPQRTSEQFNAPDADVVIRSSDGVQFSLHRKYLTATTGAFPPMEFETEDEIVDLTEDAATLELLFQFVYPQRHPSLSDSPYEVIAPLAEAAEKYEVFAAMNICQIRIVNFLPAHAEGVMAYAAKHGYAEIVDNAAPLVVPLPIGDAIRLLPQRLVVPWVIYRQQWNDILLAAITSKPNVITPCSNCRGSMKCRGCGIQSQAPLPLDLNISSISSVASIVAQAKETYSSDALAIDSWYQNIQTRLDAIQKFSTFI